MKKASILVVAIIATSYFSCKKDSSVAPAKKTINAVELGKKDTLYKATLKKDTLYRATVKKDTLYKATLLLKDTLYKR